MPKEFRIYVASSWRNKKLDIIVGSLRAAGFSAYDFQGWDERGAAFNWTDIDPDWQTWGAETFRDQLNHPLALAGFDRDMGELRAASALLLVLPCNRSAHLELGYAIGAGKPTAVLLENREPELMYRAVDRLCVNMEEVVEFLECRRDVALGTIPNVSAPPTEIQPCGPLSPPPLPNYVGRLKPRKSGR